MKGFDYDEAFSRNLGWMSRAEQQLLRGKRIAIAGMGGAGGSHLLTLTRLGVGAFTIADMDNFEVANFNRQAGSNVSTLGQPKVDVMSEMARRINPELDMRVFAQGICAENLSDFLDGVDLYVDGLDFFAFEARKMVFAECHKRQIPAITAAPVGMGVSLLVFLPTSMTFEEYFRWEGCDRSEMALRFLVGLTPAGLQRRYLIDPSTVRLASNQGPSTAIGCELCAAFAAGQAVKLLLGRGPVLAAPHVLQFDAYLNTFTRSWRPGGNRNLLQRAAMALGRTRFLRSIKGLMESGQASPS